MDGFSGALDAVYVRGKGRKILGVLAKNDSK
jgi:hypothetical protein